MPSRIYEDIDFNLLRVLSVLLETRSVTLAARKLQVSQPAVSRSLARLRKLFEDDLLVRTVGGMLLTPRAEALRGPLSAWLHEGRSILQPSLSMTSTLKRTFSIASTDFGAFRVLAPAIKQAAELMPGLGFIVTPLQADSEQRLNDGALDVIVTGLEPQMSTLHVKSLFTETFACLARSDHPVFEDDGPMTEETFLAWPHIVVTVGDSMDRVGQHLGRDNDRRILLKTTEFSTACYMLENTDAFATVPLSAARMFAKRHDVRLFEPPLALAPMDYSLIWHERSRRDPATQWLLNLLSQDIDQPIAA